MTTKLLEKPLDSWNNLPNHIAYPAKWTPNNAHLQAGCYGICRSAHLSCCQKIRLIFKRIFEAIVRFFTPSSFQKSLQSALITSSTIPIPDILDSFNKWKEQDTGRFTRYCLDLLTPDKQPIHALFYARDDLNRDVPTVIYFLGMNRQSIKSAKKMLELFSGPNVPDCNVIVFDYRGSGVNRLLYGERRFTGRDLILDADTVVQAAIHKLGFDEKDILFFGASFGGAIASIVARRYSGRFVSYNSFSSLNAVLNNSTVIRESYERHVLKAENRCPWTCLRRVSAKRALCMVACMVPYWWGWDQEPQDVLPDMKDRTLCVHHPDDTMIPVEAAAFNALPVSNLCLTKVIPSKIITDGLALHKARPDELVTHDDNKLLTDKLIEFLFPIHN